MKKMLVFGLAAMGIGLSAMAQNEHIHVFRSDKNFHTFNGAEAQTILHSDGNATTGFNTLVVQDASGNQTTISLSAIDSVQVRMTGLPDFHVTLTDPQYSGLTDLITSLGKGYEYEATLRMDGNGMYDDLPEQHVKFRGRGNSTWNMPKKPYRFKMDSKAKVCGLKKAKSFALIANFIDNSLMRNAVALWTANYLEMPFANHCIPVNVYLNGNYRGAYMLTEKIGIGGGSVDIDEFTGILFELDSNYDEDYKFQYTWSSGWTNKRLPVMVKDPDFDEICDSLGVTPTQYLSTWQADFTKMANAVTTSETDLSKYIDLEQAAKYFVVNSLANNHEMKHPKSLYLHKETIDDVYKFGPVWDFDWAFMFNNYKDETASATEPLVTNDGDMGGASFCKLLFANAAFREVYKKTWDDFVANGYPKLLEYLEEYALMIEPSAKRNGLLWETELTNYTTINCFETKKAFAQLKTWLQQRVDYCNSHANYGLY